MSDVAAFGIMFLLGSSLMAHKILSSKITRIINKFTNYLDNSEIAKEPIKDVPPIGDPVSRDGIFMGI